MLPTTFPLAPWLPRTGVCFLKSALSVSREDGLAFSVAAGQQPCLKLFSVLKLLLFLHEHLNSSSLSFW